MPEARAVARLLEARVPGLRKVVTVASLVEGGGEPDRVTIAGDDIAFIQYTSGSGGVQKGAVHTHGGVLRYIESKWLGYPFTPDDVIVCWAPLYHDQGLVSGLLTPQVVGFRSVLMSPMLAPELPTSR